MFIRPKLNARWVGRFTSYIQQRIGIRVMLSVGALVIGIITVTVTVAVLHRGHSPVTAHTSTNAQHASKTTQTPSSGTSQQQPSTSKSATPPPAPSTATTNHPSTSPPSSTSTGTSPGSTQQSGSSGGGSSGNTGGSTTTTSTYVQPGTQGYRGSLAALTIYSAANGQVPPGTSCAWNQTYAYLRCNDINLNLDHVYIKGGVYWAGCGSLTMTNSIFDWYPSQTWFDVYNACTSPATGATITASYTTFETNPSAMNYTGGSDIGGIAEYTGDVPMNIDHSLVQGFSQGFDPGADSTISNSEIYVQDNVCSGGPICHGDGLFSQGGDNITYQNNYIVAASDATSAIFYQSSPNSNGNSVIGNYLQGGSYALYNENSNNLTVINNTFGGSTYGNCSLSAGASWGTWSGNVTANGTTVVPQANGCS